MLTHGGNISHYDDPVEEESEENDERPGRLNEEKRQSSQTFASLLEQCNNEGNPFDHECQNDQQNSLNKTIKSHGYSSMTLSFHGY